MLCNPEGALFSTCLCPRCCSLCWRFWCTAMDINAKDTSYVLQQRQACRWDPGRACAHHITGVLAQPTALSNKKRVLISWLLCTGRCRRCDAAGLWRRLRRRKVAARKQCSGVAHSAFAAPCMGCTEVECPSTNVDGLHASIDEEYRLQLMVWQAGVT